MFVQLSPIWESIKETHALFMKVHSEAFLLFTSFGGGDGGGERGNPTSTVAEWGWRCKCVKLYEAALHAIWRQYDMNTNYFSNVWT